MPSHAAHTMPTYAASSIGPMSRLSRSRQPAARAPSPPPAASAFFIPTVTFTHWIKVCIGAGVAHDRHGRPCGGGGGGVSCPFKPPCNGHCDREARRRGRQLPAAARALAAAVEAAAAAPPASNPLPGQRSPPIRRRYSRPQPPLGPAPPGTAAAAAAAAPPPAPPPPAGGRSNASAAAAEASTAAPPSPAP